MQETTVTVRFPMVYRDDQNGWAYIARNDVSLSCYARSAALAAKKLRALLEQEIEQGLATAHSERWVLGTTDGTVFIVDYRHGGYGYHIGGPGHGYASGCLGFKTFNETRDAARKHAEQCFGGVAWEHSF